MSIPDGTTPFTQVDFSTPYDIRVSESFADQGIWELQIPFNKSDWNRPFYPKFTVYPITQALNLLLYKNPIPFGPYDYNKTRWQAPLKEPSPNTSLNLNLYKNPIPFGPYDYNKSSFPKYAKEPITQALNINLFKNPIPFGPFDYSKPIFPEASSEHPRQNALLLTSAIQNPFSLKDWPAVTPIQGHAGLSDQSIWDLQIPFSKTDWNTSFGQRYFWPAFIDGALIDITTPFALYDWSTGRNIPDWLPPPQYPNLTLLNTPIPQAPFKPVDWSKAFRVPSAKVDQQSVNTKLLTNPIPFALYDWSKAFNLPEGFTPQYPNIVLNGVTNPVPFSNYDWSKVSALKASIDPQYPDLVILQPVVTPTPFSQLDWSTTKFAKGSVDQLYPNFPIRQVGSPFSQLDWNKAYTLPPKASNQNDLPNLLLIQPSVPGRPLGISGWLDWSRSKWPVIIVPDQNNLPNIVLPNTIPIPPDIFVFGGKWQHNKPQHYVAETQNATPTAAIKKAAAVLSKLGGEARAKSLTATQRSNIASAAAKARWK